MKIKKWVKRIGIGFLSLIVLLLLAGVIYEQISRYNARKIEAERKGSLVDVGEHKLYYERKGNGNITVIFESGSPGDHRAWDFLSDTISKYATTITYDRAGLLWSERGPYLKNATNSSTDLANLLDKIDAPKPYILVGHSAGGLFPRPFITEHEKDIQGVIFLDSSNPNQFKKAPPEIKEKMKMPFFFKRGFFSFINEIGIPRIMFDDPLIFNSIKKGGAFDEMDYFMKEMPNDKSVFPEKPWNIPLIVISAGNLDGMPGADDTEMKKKMKEFWGSMQIENSQLSTNSKRIIAEKSNHNNIIYSEKDLITSEIIKMIKLKDTLN